MPPEQFFGQSLVVDCFERSVLARILLTIAKAKTVFVCVASGDYLNCVSVLDLPRSLSLCWAKRKNGEVDIACEI